MANQALTETELPPAFKKIARGKVRDLFAIDPDTLLFVATDRISAYDVILNNGVPGKGRLLTSVSAFWFAYLSSQLPGLQTHLLSLGVPASLRDSISPELADALEPRSMTVRRLHIVPIESIVRGYLTGSAWAEYKRAGTVHGIALPAGLQESQRLPDGHFPLWTPSTKAPAGESDLNIHPDEAAARVGKGVADRLAQLSVELYRVAHAYALERGIIIADTKFEFGVSDPDRAEETVVLADEVLTPDSSRFWPKDKYQVGRGQESLDKQPLRDWLVGNGLKGKEGVSMPEHVVRQTSRIYAEVVERLSGAASLA